MKIVVLGLGRVGLITVLDLALPAEHEVIGADIDTKKISKLMDGLLPFSAHSEPGMESMLKKALSSGLIFDHVNNVKSCDMAFVCVPTPQGAFGGANMDSVARALSFVENNMNPGGTVVMKSTVPPGAGVLYAKSLEGVGITYVSNPEFLREGHVVNDWNSPDRIILGGDLDSVAKVRQLYSHIKTEFVTTDITSAELIKHASNALLATRIAFTNQIANLSWQMSACSADVVRGVFLDPRFGIPVIPGPGYGGPCLPKDAEALYFESKAQGADLSILGAVIDANKEQRLIPVRNILDEDLLNVPNPKIAILGLAFKPYVDDFNGSVTLDMIKECVKRGAEVRTYDPVVAVEVRDFVPQAKLMHSAIDAVSGAHAVIIGTAWPEFLTLDWEQVQREMCRPSIVFDCWGVLKDQELSKFGLTYIPIH